MKQKELGYTNKYELETDFSQELKDLKSKTELNFKAKFKDKRIQAIPKKLTRKSRIF